MAWKKRNGVAALLVVFSLLVFFVFLAYSHKSSDNVACTSFSNFTCELFATLGANSELGLALPVNSSQSLLAATDLRMACGIGSKEPAQEGFNPLMPSGAEPSRPVNDYAYL